MAEQLPPGRAGRLWLLGRLRAAQRAIDLLERKRELLRRAEAEMSARQEETRRVWQQASRAAEVWALRSGMLGGARDVHLAAALVPATATVEVTPSTTVGVRYPGDARCRLAEPPPAARAAANAALEPGVVAHRVALEAAAASAVAERAWHTVDAELRATERRLRAIQRRRVPALEDALHGLELQLDELERAELLTSRWALQHRR